MSLRPPGEDDPGTKYGDPRLNQRARDKEGLETEVFLVTEEAGTLNIRCKVCEMTIFGIRNLNSHIAGKKHSGKFSSETWVLVPDPSDLPDEEPELLLPEPVAVTSTPQVDKTRVMLAEEGPVFQLVSQYKQQPIIGMEYLVEIREGPGDPTNFDDKNLMNFCLLCDQDLRTSEIISHLTCAVHRLAYLDCFFPIVRQKFAKVPNLRLWQGPTHDFLESIVMRIEARCGRLKAVTVLGRDYLQKEMKLIRATVENGIHFKETTGLNFRTIPDPFGSYLFRIPNQEIVDISVLPEPKVRPGLTIEARYQSVKPLSSNGVSVNQTGSADQQLNADKSTVLNKIANLRKEIKDDDRLLKDLSPSMKKLREDIKNKQNTEESVEKDKDLDIISDEDLPDEKELKLRKPEKRGIRSRNPDGLNSRRERTKEQEKIDDPHSKPNLETGRTLYMDKEENKKRSTNEVENHPFGDKEIRPGNSRDSHKDRDIRGGGRDEQRSRDDRDRNVKQTVKDDNRDRGGKHKDRDYRSKDDGRRKSRSRERERVRDVKEHGSSRGGRRRSHSREKERDHSRRHRSVSPFVVAMEKWNRFKKAEGVMLSNIAKRKEIFEKRPEDHPKYGEEWKMFWEKRYKELQAQGKNPSNHDFKAEWIPFWTKRVTQIFDTEVLEKTDDLMKKFELPSVAEPRRSDHIRVEKEVRRSPTPERKESRRPRETRRESRSPDRREVRSPEKREGRRSPERRGGVRNPSPPGGSSRGGGEVRGRGGYSRHDHNRSPDMYSGITELEDRRDRGRSLEADHHQPDRFSRGHEYPRLDDPQMGAVKVIPCLRLLTALEDTLGSLGPQVNQILCRALSIEQNREGASKVLLEDPDTVSILDLVREKLSGQMAAGLLEGSKEGAVRVCLDNLTRLLQSATKKRSLYPGSHLSGPRESLVASATVGSNIQQQQQSESKVEEDARQLIASSVAMVLMTIGRSDISDQELETLMGELMKQTADVDTNSSVGKVARKFTDTINREKKMAANSANQFNIYSSAPISMHGMQQQREHSSMSQGSWQQEPFHEKYGHKSPRGYPEEREKPSSMTKRSQSGTGGELDDLTIDELRSLLDNFQNLSKQEQVDLIAYTKKLEKTNPERVNQLKSRMLKNSGKDEGITEERKREEPEVVEINDDDDWAPSNKRSRRLSGSGLDMNPSAPDIGSGRPEEKSQVGVVEKFTLSNWEEREKELSGGDSNVSQGMKFDEGADTRVGLERSNFGVTDEMNRGNGRQMGNTFGGMQMERGFGANQIGAEFGGRGPSHGRGGPPDFEDGGQWEVDEYGGGPSMGRSGGGRSGFGDPGRGRITNPMFSRGGRGRF